MGEITTLWKNKIGKIHGEITENDHNGTIYRNFQVCRFYKDKKDEWQRDGRISIDQLDDYQALLDEAKAFIATLTESRGMNYSDKPKAKAAQKPKDNGGKVSADAMAGVGESVSYDDDDIAF